MKKALLVGINYAGTGNDLRGCINDVNNVQNLLSKEGFDEIKVILEKDATAAGIKRGLEWLVTGAIPGDVIFFHFSGHGSQMRSTVEPDGLDEIICPIDLDWRDNVVTDDYMKQVFNKVPNGVNVTVVLDCCHSGNALDQEDSLELTREITAPLVESSQKQGNRFLPMPEYIQTEITENKLQVREFKTSRDVNRSALLISGCQSHQTSADAFINNQFQGAATYSLLKSLSLGLSSYRDVATYMNKFMAANGFTQRPQLDGHPSLYDQSFLKPWGFNAGTLTEAPAPGTWSAPSTAPAQISDDVSPPPEEPEPVQNTLFDTAVKNKKFIYFLAEVLCVLVIAYLIIR